MGEEGPLHAVAIVDGELPPQLLDAAPIVARGAFGAPFERLRQLIGAEPWIELELIEGIVADVRLLRFEGSR